MFLVFKRYGMIQDDRSPQTLKAIMNVRHRLVTRIEEIGGVERKPTVTVSHVTTYFSSIYQSRFTKGGQGKSLNILSCTTHSNSKLLSFYFHKMRRPSP